MGKYTLLTFNFNGYDSRHSHYYSNNFDYILVSDKESESPWTVKYPEHIRNMDDWEKSLYVRYHPFEFTDSDIVIVIDGSLIITKGIEDFASSFESGKYDMGITISNQTYCMERIIRWYSKNRISIAERDVLSKYLKDSGMSFYKGCMSAGARIIRRNDQTMQWQEYTYKKLYEYGVNQKPIRLDEVVSTITICKDFPQIKCAPFSPSIIDGEVFQCTYHSTGNILHPPVYISDFYFRNAQVNPIHIGPEYSRKYKYKTEVMCLTRYLSKDGLREWIEHHLSVGFDHIHIFDNESPYPCKDICKEYGERVSYELSPGYARHYRIYDEYINSNRCNAEWVIPLDDDEYFSLNTDICKNVSECIGWYTAKFKFNHMFAIRWKHLFPKVFHSECTGSVLEYCTEENPKLASMFQAMGDRGVKTFVHRYGKIHYEERSENPSGGHVPKHSTGTLARLFNGETVTKCSCDRMPAELDEPARIIHCRYKGYSWYKSKYLDRTSPTYCYGNCDATPYIKNYRFSELLDTLP